MEEEHILDEWAEKSDIPPALWERIFTATRIIFYASYIFYGIHSVGGIKPILKKVIKFILTNVQ